MKFLRKNQENSLMSRELSGNLQFKELSLVQQVKFSFMFGVFRIFHQKPEFDLNLVCRLSVPA